MLDETRADACPIFPGKRHLDWDPPNPDGKSVNEVRAIRDEIDSRVQQLLEELVSARRYSGRA